MFLGNTRPSECDCGPFFKILPDLVIILELGYSEHRRNASNHMIEENMTIRGRPGDESILNKVN